MKKSLILPTIIVAFSQWTAIPFVQAQLSDEEPLDETQTWFVTVHGEKDSVTKMPALVRDETDKQNGDTSLSFEIAGEGNPQLWLSLRGQLKPAINVADYELLTFSYKITPNTLDRPNQKDEMRMGIGKQGADALRFDQEIHLDGEWYTVEVPISSFKQEQKMAEASPYDGEDANQISFDFFFVTANSFDVAVKIDNIHLKPRN
jgi:hypothetical protein